MLGPIEDPENSTAQKELLIELLLYGNERQVYPAALAQERLWFLDQLQGMSSAYNVHLGLWLRGTLDRNALESSLQEMVRRHDSLRTAFKLEDGELRQTIARRLTLA